MWLAIALLSAALLPLVLFVALQTAFSAETERSDVENAALDDARRISTTVDATLERTRGAAAALVTTNAVREAKWSTAYQRAKEIVDQNPDWHAATFWDRRSGRTLIDTNVPLGSPPADRTAAFDISRLKGPSDLVVGGIELEGEFCPCLFVHTAASARLPYVLTVSLYPFAFQEIVKREGQGALVTTLLDSNGLTIARSVNPERRIGRAAPDAAVPQNRRSGIYRGVTLEGARHFSAFWVSPLSGWSTHVAFEPEVLEGTSVRVAAATAIAALASLVVAAAIVALALRNFATQRRLEEQATTALRTEAAAQLAVARDLHDGVLQFLTGLNLRLYSLRRALSRGETTPEETETLFETLEREIGGEQRELRRFIENLGASLKSAEPVQSLRATATMLSRRWGAQVALSPEDADDLVPPELQRDVGFIVREAVSNAVRHGAAQSVDVAIERDREELVIVIHDDGKGFESEDTSAQSASRGPTPATILSRVVQHGGTLEIDSGASGATLRIRMPVS